MPQTGPSYPKCVACPGTYSWHPRRLRTEPIERAFFQAALRHRPAGAAAFCFGVLSLLVYSDNMIRTQISLDEHEYAIAKMEAQSLGISVAEFVRRAVREALPPRGAGPWMKFTGFVETGNTRSSQTVDEIVYGQKD